MIDWHRVIELRDEVGAEDFPEVVELFLEEVDEVIARLKTAANADTVEADLHFLKGSALNLGFSAFGEACSRGERMAADGRGADVDVGGVVACYEASLSEFNTRLHTLRPAA